MVGTDQSQKCHPSGTKQSQTTSIPCGSHSPFLLFEELFDPLSYPSLFPHVCVGWPDALRYSRTHEPYSQLWFQVDSLARTTLLVSGAVIFSWICERLGCQNGFNMLILTILTHIETRLGFRFWATSSPLQMLELQAWAQALACTALFRPHCLSDLLQPEQWREGQSMALTLCVLQSLPQLAPAWSPHSLWQKQPCLSPLWTSEMLLCSANALFPLMSPWSSVFPSLDSPQAEHS